MGPRMQPLLLTKSALIQDFIVSDYSDRFKTGIKQLAEWYNAGKLQHKETVTEGFKNVPEAFIGLFSGQNIGKQIVKVADTKGK